MWGSEPSSLARQLVLLWTTSFYQQVHGTAMGPPISLEVADLILDDVEPRALTSSTPHPTSGRGT